MFGAMGAPHLDLAQTPRPDSSAWPHMDLDLDQKPQAVKAASCIHLLTTTRAHSMKTDPPTSVDPRTRKLWRWLGLIFLLSFGALGSSAGDLPRGAADPPGRGQRRGRSPLHGADPARPAGLALRRRPAARHRLGPRQLRGARLVGRLAAPRSGRPTGDPREADAQPRHEPHGRGPRRRRRRW